MPKHYSTEKGKYGLTTGTIVPFGVTLDGTDPANLDWTRLVPAGFLRCDGSIRRARDFLALAQVLGVGSNSKFRKFDQELEELSEDFRQGQFQLPDLGSKYMSAATANGLYNNIIVVDPDSGTEFPRVGVEVELTLNAGNAIEVVYNGDFTFPTTPVVFSPSANFGTTLSSVVTDATILDSQYLSHGHDSNAAVLKREEFLSTDNDGFMQRDTASIGIRTPSTSFSGARPGFLSDRQITITEVGGSESATQHSHSLQRSTVSKSITSNISRFQIPPDNIVTTVNLSSRNTFKMDDIQHKFIIVEFLIKT